MDDKFVGENRWETLIALYAAMDDHGRYFCRMIDIETLVGKDNMSIDKKEAVIALLQKLDQPGTTKRFLYARWVRLVGYQARREDIDTVANYGTGGV